MDEQCEKSQEKLLQIVKDINKELLFLNEEQLKTIKYGLKEILVDMGIGIREI